MREAIRKASRSPAVGDAFRVIEFSVQNDHVHLLVEAHDKDTLSRGLRGLVTRLAVAIHRALDMGGNVWGDRYHARALTTPRAVRNALVYVLMNTKKHHTGVSRGIDAFSSAPWFDGFAVKVTQPDESAPTRALDERPRAPS